VTPTDSPYFRRILKKYGLTIEAFLQMLVAQDSKCLVCDRELVLLSSDRREIPCVDHKHREDGRNCTPEDVRGLLCTKCNTKIGHLEKDPYTTYAGLAYLGNPQDKYPGVKVEARERRERFNQRKHWAQPELERLACEMEKLLTFQLADASIINRD
jgi:hypothetical protein